MVREIIEPGSTIGVLGSGQLGRMMAIAARRLGYCVHVLSPEADSPTGQVADIETVASYDDIESVSAFARSVQVVTFEFENVPLECAEAAACCAPVRPSGAVLHTTQHRVREKSFLRDAGFPVTKFSFASKVDDVAGAVDQVGLPAVIKTSAWGYDGKGQKRIESLVEAINWFEQLGGVDVICEAFVPFKCEVSVIVSRSLHGSIEHFGPILNVHKDHILDLSICPAELPVAVASEAVEIARAVARKFDYVGTLCVEFFVLPDDCLCVNEIAPRPHNSGHLTIDAHMSCQFEQHVRAICGLPLSSTQQLRPAAMANLLGDIWSGGNPNWAAACDHSGVKLHLYGKHQARPRRKMGHLTAIGDSAEAAVGEVLRARASLIKGSELL